MGSVKSSVKGWKTAATRLAVLIVIVLQALGLGAVLATGTRSTADRRGIRQAGKNLPQPGRRRSRRLRHQPRALGLRWNFFPPASATRSAGWAARTDGWISARATGRPYWTTTHPKTTRRRVKSAPGPAARCARSRCP